MTPRDHTPASSRDLLLCSLGTRGDIQPFLLLARELTQRGHRVAVASNSNWRDNAIETGAEFIPIAAPDPPQDQRNHTEFMRGHFHASQVRLLAVARAWSRGRLACGAIIFKSGLYGAECAYQALGLSAVRVALQPSAIRSSYRPPWPLPAAGPGLGGTLTRLGILTGHRLLDAVGRESGHYRDLANSVGLDGCARARFHALQEIPTVITTPEWFAWPADDWPEHSFCVGFILPRVSPWNSLPDMLRSFLKDRPPPLAFTYGTGVADTARFFQSAAEVCGQLRRPGVMIGRAPTCVEEGGDLLISVPTVDLSALLPRCAIFIHHGGIGTIAEGLRAGIPQVIMPRGFDQPDNAHRLARVGLASVCVSGQPTSTAMLRTINAIQSHAEAAVARAVASEAVNSSTPISAIIDLIEGRCEQSGQPLREGGAPDHAHSRGYALLWR